MNGIDAIVFTAGVGENQINIRKGICENLKWMGVELDLDANNVRGEEKEISTPDSKIKVFVVPTNEELMIALDTERDNWKTAEEAKEYGLIDCVITSRSEQEEK